MKPSNKTHQTARFLTIRYPKSKIQRTSLGSERGFRADSLALHSNKSDGLQPTSDILHRNSHPPLPEEVMEVENNLCVEEYGHRSGQFGLQRLLQGCMFACFQISELFSMFFV